MMPKKSINVGRREVATMEPGWLKRQLDRVEQDVAQWPPWMKEAFKRDHPAIEIPPDPRDIRIQGLEQRVRDSERSGQQAADSYQSLGEESYDYTNKLESRIDELEQKVRALEADRERLDWLDRQEPRTLLTTRPSTRAAIDRAMAEWGDAARKAAPKEIKPKPIPAWKHLAGQLCTCHSHQFVECRGKEGLGDGWICEDEWLRKKAEQEDGCIVSAGGLVTDLEDAARRAAPDGDGR